jgi:hypothetical protein
MDRVYISSFSDVSVFKFQLLGYSSFEDIPASKMFLLL